MENKVCVLRQVSESKAELGLLQKYEKWCSEIMVTPSIIIQITT